MSEPSIARWAFGEDDLLGAGPLDRSIIVTRFRELSATTKTEAVTSLRSLAREIAVESAPQKSGLPLLKLARLGELRTEDKSLRHNANVLAISGVEADVDSGLWDVDEVCDRLFAAKVAALVYTSPSSSADHPRLRVLCPTSESLPPDERERLCARINGLLAGELDGSSFVLSQSFYYGRIGPNPAHRVELVDGRYIDCAHELDAAALNKNGAPYGRAIEPADDDEDWDPRRPDWKLVSEALEAIPPGVEYADWLRVGAALHHASKGEDEGFKLFDQWSRGWEHYKEGETARKWRSFGRRKHARAVKIGSLFFLAKQHGWARQATSGRLILLTPDQCASAPRRGYVIKGILAPGDVACIFGAPGAGKSLLAPHLGYMIAQGREAFGMRTKPGVVFYCAAEDPTGLSGRVTALMSRHGCEAGFKLIPNVSDLFDKESPDLEALMELVAVHRPAAVFIDTVAMAFPGLEENSSEAMARVVQVARSLAALGSAVILIHHDTKAQGSTPRGHSVLNGALDMALLVEKDDDGIVRGKLTKNRNGTCFLNIAFRIGTVEIGTDEDGDPITPALAEELSAFETPKRLALSAAQKAALAELRRLAAGEAGRSADMSAPVRVSEDAWWEACLANRAVSAAKSEKDRERCMRRIIQDLTGQGLIAFSGSRVYEVKALSFNDVEDDF